MTTLKKIGEELGLSVTTVSRALNGFPEVREATRLKVREAADRLGYRPNRVAQRLVTGRSGMVGMIVKIKPDMSADQTFFEILTGLTAALARHEIDLVLAVDQEADPVLPYVKLLERNILDGFVLNAPVVDDPRVAFLRKRKIPFVLHGHDRPDPDYPLYSIDNHAVAADSVKLLAQLGHTRIALINGPMKAAYAVDRLAGFRDAIAAFGLSVDMVRGDATSQSLGYTHALDLLSGGTPPTGFVCADTLIASGVVGAVRDRGLSVPRDVSVIAHDDALPLMRAISFDPALTVTRAPLREACGPLADKLAAHLDGAPASALQTILRADLIIRGSTGPAPHKEPA